MVWSLKFSLDTFKPNILRADRYIFHPVSVTYLLCEFRQLLNVSDLQNENDNIYLTGPWLGEDKVFQIKCLV